MSKSILAQLESTGPGQGCASWMGLPFQFIEKATGVTVGGGLGTVPQALGRLKHMIHKKMQAEEAGHPHASDRSGFLSVRNARVARDAWQVQLLPAHCTFLPIKSSLSGSCRT